MFYLALLSICTWFLVPNLALLLVTRDENYHIGFGFATFLPWSLFGLSLLQ